MLKTCASHFQLRLPFIAVWSSQAAPELCTVQPSPSWCSQCPCTLGVVGAVQLLPGFPREPLNSSQAGCPRAWWHMPGKARWLPRQSACLASTGSLSASKPAFISQVCNSAAPGVSLAGSELFCSLCTASAAALSKGLQRNGCWGLKPEGKVLSLLPTSLSRVSLNFRHLRKAGWVV